jgi:hypothetical protein
MRIIDELGPAKPYVDIWRQNRERLEEIGNLFAYVADGDIDKCKEIIDLCGYQGVLYIPTEHLTEEFIIYYVHKYSSSLSKIPESRRTYKICKIASEGNFPCYLKDVPEIHRTEEICRKCLKYINQNIDYVPNKFKDKLLREFIDTQCITSGVVSILRDYLTEEQFVKTFNRALDAVDYELLYSCLYYDVEIVEKYFTQDIVDKLFEECGYPHGILNYLPEKFKTKDFCLRFYETRSDIVEGRYCYDWIKSVPDDVARELKFR